MNIDISRNVSVLIILPRENTHSHDKMSSAPSSDYCVCDSDAYSGIIREVFRVCAYAPIEYIGFLSGVFSVVFWCSVLVARPLLCCSVLPFRCHYRHHYHHHNLFLSKSRHHWTLFDVIWLTFFDAIRRSSTFFDAI